MWGAQDGGEGEGEGGGLADLQTVVVRTADDVVPQAEHGGVDCLRVALEHVDRVDGRGPEVPESKGRVIG